MTDQFLITMILYIIFLAFGYCFRKETFLRVIAGLDGLLLALLMMNEGSAYLNVSGFGILLFNIYILFIALYEGR